MRQFALQRYASGVPHRCLPSRPAIARWLRRITQGLLTLALLLASVACFSADGSGRLALKTFDVSDFRAVALSGEGDVTITPGAFAVSVSAEDDVLPTVYVQRRDETLVIGRDVDLIDGIRATLPIDVRIAMPALDGVSVSGSGSVAVRGGGFEKTALQLEITGAGSIDLAEMHTPALVVEMNGAGRLNATGLEARDMQATVRGAGQVALAGVAETTTVLASGASLFRASELRALKANVDVTGAGQVTVWAEEALQVRIDGSGRVLYRGEPTIQQAIQRDGQLVALGVVGDVEGTAGDGRPEAELQQ